MSLQFAFNLLNSFYLYIHPPDSPESDGGGIHGASNYPDLLPEMPRLATQRRATPAAG